MVSKYLFYNLSCYPCLPKTSWNGMHSRTAYHNRHEMVRAAPHATASITTIDMAWHARAHPHVHAQLPQTPREGKVWHRIPLQGTTPHHTRTHNHQQRKAPSVLVDIKLRNNRIVVIATRTNLKNFYSNIAGKMRILKRSCLHFCS